MSNVEHKFEDYSDMESYFDRCDHPSDVWEGRVARNLLVEENTIWVMCLANWRIFITLTFRDLMWPDIAKKRFKNLIRVLNKDLVGKNYTKKVKHSYFSYVVGMEYQRRGIVHFHVLIDKPVDFDKIHRIWNAWAGFAQTSIIRNEGEAVKYVLKGGEIEPWKAVRDWIPDPLPYWWKSFEADNDL